jgi:hypothetical protein
MALFDKLDLQPEPSEVRRFGLRTLAFAPVAAIAWFGLLRLTAGAWLWHLPAIILTVGLVVGLSCSIAPRPARIVHVGWHGLVALLDWVVVSIALLIVYGLVFTPIGLILRIIGRNPLLRRPDPDRKTYWQPAEKVTDLQRYHRQF